jgi:hypothetical protein
MEWPLEEHPTTAGCEEAEESVARRLLSLECLAALSDTTLEFQIANLLCALCLTNGLLAAETLQPARCSSNQPCKLLILECPTGSTGRRKLLTERIQRRPRNLARSILLTIEGRIPSCLLPLRNITSRSAHSWSRRSTLFIKQPQHPLTKFLVSLRAELDRLLPTRTHDGADRTQLSQPAKTRTWVDLGNSVR